MPPRISRFSLPEIQVPRMGRPQLPDRERLGLLGLSALIIAAIILASDWEARRSELILQMSTRRALLPHKEQKEQKEQKTEGIDAKTLVSSLDELTYSKLLEELKSSPQFTGSYKKVYPRILETYAVLAVVVPYDSSGPIAKFVAKEEYTKRATLLANAFEKVMFSTGEFLFFDDEARQTVVSILQDCKQQSCDFGDLPSTIVSEYQKFIEKDLPEFLLSNGLSTEKEEEYLKKIGDLKSFIKFIKNDILEKNDNNLEEWQKQVLSDFVSWLEILETNERFEILQRKKNMENVFRFIKADPQKLDIKTLQKYGADNWTSEDWALAILATPYTPWQTFLREQIDNLTYPQGYTKPSDSSSNTHPKKQSLDRETSLRIIKGYFEAFYILGRTIFPVDVDTPDQLFREYPWINRQAVSEKDIEELLRFLHTLRQIDRALDPEDDDDFMENLWPLLPEMGLPEAMVESAGAFPPHFSYPLISRSTH